MNKKEWMEWKRNEKIENPTRGELAMRVLLRGMGVKFVEEKRGTKDGICRFYDFFLREKRIVIEVDGGYHCPDIDKPKEDEIKRLYPSWGLIRFKNEEVLDTPDKVKRLIELKLMDQSWSGSRLGFKKVNGVRVRATGDSKKAKALIRARSINS